MIRIPNSWAYVSWDELKEQDGDFNYLGKSSFESEIYPYKVNNGVVYYSTLTKSYSATNGDECKDFFDNYKSISDNRIYLVDINRYSLKYLIGESDISCPGEGTYTEVASVSGCGAIDFIFLEFDNNKFGVKLEIDNEQKYDLSIKDLDSNIDFDRYMSTAGSSKAFKEEFPQPAFFNTGFKISVKNNDSSTKKIKSYQIRYRI